MKKKAGLIAAVLHTPDFLILDEPFSGLDPIAAQECVDFIKMYSNSKRTILLSTHNLNYVEESADQIVVLENQSVQFDGNTNDFTKNGSARISSVLMGLLKRQKKIQTKPDCILFFIIHYKKSNFYSIRKGISGDLSGLYVLFFFPFSMALQYQS